MKEGTLKVSTNDRPLPRSVLVAALVVILFLALLALEISHGLFRKNGTIARSFFFFPPVLLVLWGMLTHRRWAWLAARAAACLAAFVYTSFGVVACIVRWHDQYGPVWVWLAAVSFVLASCLFAGFVALGRPSTTAHYRLECPACGRRLTGLKDYFGRNATCRSCGQNW